LVLVGLAGCGGGDSFEIAPVSGTVTLNGQPLADATIGFQPSGGEKEQGPGSSGKTDAQGRYTLTTNDGRRGATVGTHQVRISTLKMAENKDVEDASIFIKLSKSGSVLAPEKVPSKYAKEEPLTFTIPSGGTDKADFNLSGDPPPPIHKEPPAGRGAMPNRRR